jgi:hypothetical protein
MRLVFLDIWGFLGPIKTPQAVLKPFNRTITLSRSDHSNHSQTLPYPSNKTLKPPLNLPRPLADAAPALA